MRADNVRSALTAPLPQLGFHFLNNQKTERKQKNQTFHFCKINSFQVKIQVKLVLDQTCGAAPELSALSLWNETKRLLQFSRTSSGPSAASPRPFSLSSAFNPFGGMKRREMFHNRLQPVNILQKC